MDHLAKPLEALAARAAAFVADPEARVLFVSVDEDLAEPALQIVLGLEWHPENTRPLVPFTTPHTAKDAGWAERSRALRAEYERRQAAYDAKAIELPDLGPPSTEADPLLAFGLELRQVAKAFGDPELGTEGVIALLAPEKADDPGRIVRDLRRLLDAPALATVRWIWIHKAAGPAEVSPPLLEALGEHVWRCPCHVDPEQARRDADAMLAGLTRSVASGGTVARGARPKASPPRHPSDPPPAPSPPNDGADPGPQAFLVPLLKAVQSLRDGDALAALPLLREARDVSLGAGRLLEATEMELLLATTGAHAGLQAGAGIARATPVFHAAIERAEKANLLPAAAKGALALGAFANLAKDAELAAGSFMKAAALAKRANLPVLEFQALRMAGEVGVMAGARERGADRLKDALDLAAALPPAEAKSSGLSEGALDLVAFCKKHGLDAVAKHAEAALAKEA